MKERKANISAVEAAKATAARVRAQAVARLYHAILAASPGTGRIYQVDPSEADRKPDAAKPHVEVMPFERDVLTYAEQVVDNAISEALRFAPTAR